MSDLQNWHVFHSLYEGDRFGFDMETGETWKFEPGEDWQGPVHITKWSEVTKVDQERGSITLGAPEWVTRYRETRRGWVERGE